MYRAYVSCIVLHSVVAEPVALVVAFHAWSAAPAIMSWKKRFVAFALAFESLQLRSHIHCAVGIVAYIKRYNAYGVACNEKLIALLIVEGKGKDATKVLKKVDAFVAIERENNLTVGACLKLILTVIALAYILMVVYLAVYSKHLLAIRREQWLATRLRVYY